jgi:hypothetical protein
MGGLKDLSTVFAIGNSAAFVSAKRSVAAGHDASCVMATNCWGEFAVVSNLQS